MEDHYLMKKYFTLFLFLFIAIISLAAEAIFLFESRSPITIDAIKNQGNFYVKVDDLVYVDSMVINHTSRIIYIIYNKDVLEISLNDYYSKLNFINKYDDSVLILGKDVYLREDVLSTFLKLNTFKNLDTIYFYSKVPKITDLKVGTNQIDISFNTELPNKSITLTQISEENGYLLSIKPISPLEKIPANVDYSYSNNTVYLKFKSDFSYDIILEGKNLSIIMQSELLTDGLLKSDTETSQTRDGFKYVERVEELNGQKLKIYMATIDPRKYEVKIDLNQLGVRSDVATYLNDKKPLFSVNASFFDPQTLEPVGNIMSEGELLHLSSYSRPAFIISKNSNADIDYIKLEYQMKINNLLFWVKSINSNWKGDVKLYTHHYKGDIFEQPEAYSFLLLDKNDKIISKNKNIPRENEKLLAIDKKYEKYLSSISIGDQVEFTLNKSENLLSDPVLLIEGGPILLNPDFNDEQIQAEKRSYSNGIIYGKSPRSLVAIDNQGNVNLMVIEGYDNPDVGVNYDEARNLLINMGNFTKAMLLDGGSSSIVYYDGKIQNYKDGKTRSNIPVLISVYEK
jgi:hypothetical protein